MGEWNEKKCKEVFTLFDTNGEGTIMASQVGEVLRASGQTPTNKEIQKAIAGRKATDEVDWYFFLPIAQKMAKGKQVTEEEFLDCLLQNENLETSGKNSVRAADLRDVLIKMGERLTEAQVDEVLQGQGENIDCRKFVKMMMGDT